MFCKRQAKAVTKELSFWFETASSCSHKRYQEDQWTAWWTLFQEQLLQPKRGKMN